MQHKNDGLRAAVQVDFLQKGGRKRGREEGREGGRKGRRERKE